ncbi:LANO_0H22914g1_1 [Lachancea nothofagi CBS 11611]|uniref:LANO_0H22914g1_1 n=1 Tax=Lachancea nothofagi CBS 11611 TaxID=1266666 RepID=A0A1G4KNY3_9SACH|nr:LANO_0H22914g1_1 [Lachancea nothofagi CBS 11611]
MLCRSHGLRNQLRQARSLNCQKRQELHGDLRLKDPTELLGFVQIKLAQQEVNGLKTLKNKLQRQLGYRYAAFMTEMRQAGTLKPDLVQMIFFQKAGSRQYQAFTSSLQTVIDSTGSVETKKKQLYTLLQLQKALYPQVARENGILVPESVHLWFWDNVEKTKSFEHFYFLIQNNVLLGSQSANRFLNRLLKGSEMELQLASFQIFLHNPQHHKIYHESFIKLYSFAQINRITTTLLSKKDFRHIKLYFTALLERLEANELQALNLPQEKRTALFIRFTNTLLKFLEESQNCDMFLQSFKMVLELVHTQKLSLELLHKPLLLAIRLLRRLNEHSHVLQLISLAQELDLRKSFKFKQSLIGELISTLRSFNDPKIILSYITTVYANPTTVPLLNELGLWGLLHHNSLDRLSTTQLERDCLTLIKQKSQLSQFLTQNLKPSSVALTELYRVTLQYMRNTMPPLEFKQLVVVLYHRYVDTLKINRGYFIYPDCGVLNVLIHNLRYPLKEDRLAYQLVLDFFQAGLHLACSKSSPFGLLMYHNYTLTMTEISTLLVLMDQHGIKLDFKMICSMVFQNLRSGQIDEARSWYEKALAGGFPISHKLLIKRAVENNWKLPTDTDISFLDEPPQPQYPFGSGFDDVDDLVSSDLMEEEYEGTSGFANELLDAVGTFKRLSN